MKKNHKRQPSDSPGESSFPAAKRPLLQLNNHEDDQDVSQQPDFYVTDSTVPEPGIIERITLKNFVCHEHLNVSLGKNVTFLTGQNGSGKSAILSAVVLGLGGKSAATGRGSTLKTFIKTGKQYAEICVQLRNDGEEGYKKDLYGDRIFIERRIGQDSSTYKLKNCLGKVISTKKEELAGLTDELNIQIDNPVTILNQDTSRNFLQTSSPMLKYKFFMRATQLENMRQDYKKAQDLLTDTKTIVDKKKGTVPTLQAELREWEKKYKAFETLDALKDKIATLEKQMAWSIIAEKEKSVEVIRKDFVREEKSTPKYESKFEETKDQVNSCEESILILENYVKTVDTDLEKLTPGQEEIRKQREVKRKATTNAKLELRNIDGQAQSSKKDISTLKNRITHLKNSADDKMQRESQLKQMKGLEEQLTTLEAKKKSQEHEQKQLQSAKEKAKEELKQNSHKKADLDRRLSEVQTNLSTLISSKNNRIRRFGSYMPDLVKSIEKAYKEKKFQKKPLGPIGSMLSLRDEQWAPAVQICLGGLIHAFCVDNHQDRQQLEKLLKTHCGNNVKKPPIITSKFRPQLYDVSKHAVHHRDYPSVLQMLEVSEPVVTNFLIDQRSIENVLLIPNKLEARDIMLDNPPRNCKEAFTLNGTQLYPKPSFRMYSADKDRTQSLLAADIESSIRDLNTTKTNLEKEQKRFMQLQDEKMKEIQRNETVERQCSKALSKIKADTNRLMFELQELKAYKPPSEQDIAMLESELADNEENLKNILQRREETAKRLADLEAEVKKAEEVHEAQEKKYQALVAKKDRTQGQMAQLRNQLKEFKRNASHYENKLKEHNQRVQELKDDLTKKEELLKEDLAKAEQICPRLKVGRASKNLESEINQIMKQIQAEEKTKGNKEEITRKYLEKKDQFDMIRQDVIRIDSFIILLEEQLSIRFKKFQSFRKSVSIVTKIAFQELLQNRGYEGNMVFDHKREELQVSVQPVKQQEGSRDLKSLSGGERSFSTVCFILALWDTMESPFRMLDEFDVFMDMVNRRIAMDMMLKMTRQRHTHQFIFLTPQDWSNLKVDTHVTILALPAPRRSGATRAQEREEEED